ncbi:MAG: hypothetical protein ACI4NO_07085 [Oxalobacter sp.]
MKKRFWMICPVLLVLFCLNTASAAGVDAYRPKKTGNSLSCRFDDPCDSTEKAETRSDTPGKAIKKTMKYPSAKQIRHHAVR